MSNSSIGINLIYIIKKKIAETFNKLYLVSTLQSRVAKKFKNNKF